MRLSGELFLVIGAPSRRPELFRELQKCARNNALSLFITIGSAFIVRRPIVFGPIPGAPRICSLAAPRDLARKKKI